LVAAPFLSGETHLAELEQKLQALVREQIGEANNKGDQGGGGRKRRKRRRTRRRRGGMNPIGNPDSSWSILTENGEENENENTVEIHNVENASGIAMQKQAGKAGVIEGGNTATLKRGPSKTRKRSHSWP